MHAALQVYGGSGLRGATTRRIAQVAGVNEVTLFRHFGSKDVLIQEALAWAAEQRLDAHLPDVPDDPEAELLAFSGVYHHALSTNRSLVRTCMAEFDEHPETTLVATRTSSRLSRELEAYLDRLRSAGLASGDWEARAAAGMLMGTLFADAMGRDCMPERYSYPEDEALRHYLHLFLRAIGADRAAGARDFQARTPE